jgi:hypothetical protein
MTTDKTLSHAHLLAVAEDIEHFRGWWEHSEAVDNTTIRHGSAGLRRLLVDDSAGAAWRQIGYTKSPTLQGPDLLESLRQRGIPIDLIATAAAAGVRFAGMDTAFLGGYRADNPTTGIPATAEEGFAVVVTSAVRKVDGATPSEMDALIRRTWHLHEYLDAPGLIRKGELVNRREVIKHVANEMGGVHIHKSTSNYRDLLTDAESKLFIENKAGFSLRTMYIEVLAIGQAVGHSEDFQKLAKEIREIPAGLSA